MLPGGFVGKFGKFADEFFKHRTHLGIADDFGMEVNRRKLFRDEVEQPGLGEFIYLRVKLEALENVPHGGRERLHVGA